MPSGDTIQNAAENVVGKAKEAAGETTDDGRLEAEGKTGQPEAETEQPGEHVKDVLR